MPGIAEPAGTPRPCKGYRESRAITTPKMKKAVTLSRHGQREQE